MSTKWKKCSNRKKFENYLLQINNKANSEMISNKNNSVQDGNEATRISSKDFGPHLFLCVSLYDLERRIYHL